MEIRCLVTGFAIFLFICFTVTTVVFFYERSGRAAYISLFAGIIIPFTLFFLSVSQVQMLYFISVFVTFVTILFIVLILIPLKGRVINYCFPDKAMVDERDTMFSKKELKPGSKLYKDYYLQHPKKESIDKKWRSEPGLLSEGSLFYNLYAFAAAAASFETVKLFAGIRDSEPNKNKSEVSSDELTSFIKNWGKKLGAIEVGITEMKDNHYYTSGGRGDRYGRIINREHKYGIVFLVEMDYALVSAAPRSPVVVESANQYLRSGAIATQVAVMIRNIGYSAKTHIDGNYDIICPLVARDAALGEIGRHGLLISEKFGPRVRISVVTTDIPLVVDKAEPDQSVIKFCSLCKKCAENCPAQAIPKGAMADINGTIKWQLNQESCFTYWNHSGTDCGRCLSTCPFSHRNNWFHKLIRRGIRNNHFFLTLASVMDDIFYGKRPPTAKYDNFL